jgi:hypothetical protein
MEHLGSSWTDFRESWYLSSFRQSVETVKVSLKSDKKTGTFHEDQYTFMTYLAQFFLEREKFQAKV